MYWISRTPKIPSGGGSKHALVIITYPIRYYYSMVPQFVAGYSVKGDGI